MLKMFKMFGGVCRVLFMITYSKKTNKWTEGKKLPNGSGVGGGNKSALSWEEMRKSNVDET